MSTWDELKNTFFDECREGLEAVEAGLTEIRSGAPTSDSVNGVFRAVHSVKGGAGVFGFDSLVGFAHVFETVLDAVRQDKLAITPEVVDVMLSAADILSDFVAMAQNDQAPPEGFGGEIRGSLERLIEADGMESGDNAAADFDGLDFVPVQVDSIDDFSPVSIVDNATNGEKIRISLRPRPAALSDDAAIHDALRALRKQGGVNVACDATAVPLLSDIDPRQPLLQWTLTLDEPVDAGDLDRCLTPLRAAWDIEVTGAVEQSPVPLMPAMLVEAPSMVAQADPVSAPVASSMLPDAPAAAPPRESGSATHAPAPTTIRVDLDKIDRVVNMVGEIVIAQAMLGQSLEEADVGGHHVGRILEELLHHTRELKNSVMSMRAQPVRSVFQRMTRLVRDLATKTGKKVELEMIGEATEVDKTIIERLSDPLTHIIRNSVDHGLETPNVRLASDKNPTGTIRLSAEQRGGRIVIEISDDGAGINTERVLAKARERGLISADAVLTEDEVSNLIFLPGFSTAEAVSDISGRGVGMDVVRRNIQDLGGRITLKSERGRGMSIQLSLPLTLAVMDGMIVKAAGETYVMPIASIVECIRPAKSEMHALVGTRGMLRVRENIVPLVQLTDVFGLGRESEVDECVVIIVETDGDRIGLVVDELCGHQQVVIKSIEENYESVAGIAAATILGNGRVAFIVDIEKLFELGGAAGYAGATMAPLSASVH